MLSLLVTAIFAVSLLASLLAMGLTWRQYEAQWAVLAHSVMRRPGSTLVTVTVRPSQPAAGYARQFRASLQEASLRPATRAAA